MTARTLEWVRKVEAIVDRFKPMQPFDTNEAVAQYNDLLDLARRMAGELDHRATAPPKLSEMMIPMLEAVREPCKGCGKRPVDFISGGAK